MSSVGFGYSAGEQEYRSSCEGYVQPVLDDLWVHKDERDLPLDGVDEKIYKKARKVLIEITQEKKYFHIKGDPPFVRKIERAIETLLCRNTGRKLIFNLIRALKDRKIEIVKGKINEIRRLTIFLNMKEEYVITKLDDDQLAPLPSPLFIILGHEMIHALHNLERSTANPRGKPSKEFHFQNIEEQRTITGNDPHGYSDINENSLRKEHGLGHRICQRSAEDLTLEVDEMVRAKDYVNAGKMINRILSIQNEDQKHVALTEIATIFFVHSEPERAKQILGHFDQVAKTSTLINAFSHISTKLVSKKKPEYLQLVVEQLLENRIIGSREKNEVLLAILSAVLKTEKPNVLTSLIPSIVSKRDIPIEHLITIAKWCLRNKRYCSMFSAAKALKAHHEEGLAEKVLHEIKENLSTSHPPIIFNRFNSTFSN